MADDIRTWLTELDLEKYAPAFVDEEIAICDLQDLTDEDLKEMGLPIGPRRRVLRAISAMVSKWDAPDPSVADTVTVDPVQSLPPRSGPERRQLTILFCDLVGSTQLANRVDPEELRATLHQYQITTVAAIKQYGGFVAKYLGDGILAYFGWPEAHEDQAARAVHAGLTAVADVGKLSTPDGRPLEARAGISTGLVVIGDLVSEVGQDLDSVAGDAPNLASRLQGAASPGTTLIDETTRNLLGNAFDLAIPVDLSLKGYSRPVRAWRAIAARDTFTRFEASHDALPTRFIGRQSELNLLVDRWERALAGEGQVVLVSGEAGMGKSSLLQAFRSQIREHPHTWLTYQCSPFHVGVPFFPIKQKFMRDAGLDRSDGADTHAKKLMEFLDPAGSEDPAEISAIAALLDLRAAEPTHLDGLTPHQLRDRIRRSLISQLLKLSRQRPVLLVFEDVHWIDPSSAELLRETIELLRTNRQ